jgi:GNAT superfamily N-acetyltransferase
MKIRKHTTLHPNDKVLLREFTKDNYPGKELNWEDDEIVFYVFIRNKFIVGILATLEYEHGKTCIMLMVVDRKHLHRGIGTRMLEHIVTRHPDHDISSDIKLRDTGLLYFYCSHEYLFIEEILHKKSIVVLTMRNNLWTLPQHKDFTTKKVSHITNAIKSFVRNNYYGPLVDMDSPDIECLLALYKNTIKGIVLTKPCGTRGTHVKLLVVASDYRGKGIGSLLLAYTRYIYPGNKVTLNVLLKDAGVLNFFCNKGYAVLHPSHIASDCVTLSIAKVAVLSRIPLPVS